MTLYEILARKLPFEGMSLMEITLAVCVEDKRPELASVDEALSLNSSLSVLVDMMKFCWQTSASDRPTFDQVTERLKELAPRRMSRAASQLRAVSERITQAKRKVEDEFDAAWGKLVELVVVTALL